MHPGRIFEMQIRTKSPYITTGGLRYSNVSEVEHFRPGNALVCESQRTRVTNFAKLAATGVGPGAPVAVVTERNRLPDLALTVGFGGYGRPAARKAGTDYRRAFESSKDLRGLAEALLYLNRARRFSSSVCDTSVDLSSRTAARDRRLDLRVKSKEIFAAPKRMRIQMAVPAVAIALAAFPKLDAAPMSMPMDVGTSALEIRRPGLGGDFKRLKPLLVWGHRGCGKNGALSIRDVLDTRLNVRENTVRSFNIAAGDGADKVEFDVQVTKDGHPVIFHDDLLLSEGKAYSIKDLTLAEFKAFGPQEFGKAGRPLERATTDGKVLAWFHAMEDQMCSLKEVFEFADPAVGFNIEMKFHNSDETSEFELRRSIKATLEDVSNYPNRSVVFSSFHPDAAIMLRQMQSTHPVYFLTDGGENIYDDVRRNSIQAAIEVSKTNGLQGIVTEVLAILKHPRLARLVKEAGLGLMTYGDMNNVPEALVQQYNLNVDGVIVDCVREVVTASLTLHALFNFEQPDWSLYLHTPTTLPMGIKAQ